MSVLQISIILSFILLILFIGIWAARKNPGQGDLILSNRQLPLWLALFTMSATWIGGGYINGTAEYTASAGLVWVQAPWCYALSLIIGGVFYARPMRRKAYQTMLDPLEERFGQRVTGVLFIPALLGEVCWAAAILTALGTTFSVILDLPYNQAMIASGILVLVYTSLGGLWSVAVTDLVQLIFILGGLILVLPFAFHQSGGFANVDQRYLQNLGSAAKFLPSRANVGPLIGYWLDSGLLLIFGGIPWQVYFQRVLAAKNEEVAMRLSIGAGFVCLLAAIPAILIGMIANTTDWTVFGIQFDNPSLSLPLVIRYLTPGWVAVVGLGAILAAVTSSMDSSMLSASSMFSWNILKPLSRRPVSINKSVRISIWVIGLVTVFIALKVDSIYALWFLCSDLVYCLLFPALTLALFDLKTHRQGIIAGLIVALVIRSSGGEPLLHIAPWFPYNQSAEGIILLPFKTMAMLANFLVAMSFSRWFLKPKTA